MDAQQQAMLEDRITALEVIIETVLPLLVEHSPARARLGVLLTRLDMDRPEQYQENAALDLLLDKLLPAAGA